MARSVSVVVVGGQAERLSDGDVIDAGGYELRVIHTPGRTREHVSYALEDGSGRIVGVFTGGSMLFDSTGRTDLLGDDHTHALTVDQYKSVRRLAAELQRRRRSIRLMASAASARPRRWAGTHRLSASSAR